MELLLHFADEAFGVPDQVQGASVASGNVNLATFVGKNKAATYERPLGDELATDRVDRTFRVGLEVPDSGAEVLEGNIHQPSLEAVEVRDAHVNRLSVVAAQVEVDAADNGVAVGAFDGLETRCHLSFSITKGDGGPLPSLLHR